MNSVSWQDFRRKAAQAPQRLVLADGNDLRAHQAAAKALTEELAQPVLLGDRSRMESLWKEVSGKGALPGIDPAGVSAADKAMMAEALHQLPKFNALSVDELHQKLNDPLIWGCLMVKRGQADGFIGGATRTTADTLRAVFSVIGLAPKTSTLFGFFFMERRGASAGENSLVLLGDCAVIPEPSSKQLANIALGSAEAFEFFTGEKARVAMLSFSTAGSAVHELVDRTREATKIAREKKPGLQIEGEWQADAALDVFSAKIKGAGNSPLAGRANVLIAPTLECGNIAYKLVQRLGGCRAVGPVLWGTALPANDLSRGCSSEDIVDMMALTGLQAQARQHTDSTPQLSSKGPRSHA